MHLFVYLAHAGLEHKSEIVFGDADGKHMWMWFEKVAEGHVQVEQNTSQGSWSLFCQIVKLICHHCDTWRKSKSSSVDKPNMPGLLHFTVIQNWSSADFESCRFVWLSCLFSLWKQSNHLCQNDSDSRAFTPLYLKVIRLYLFTSLFLWKNTSKEIQDS